jgi:Cu+-exporting ATPase
LCCARMPAMRSIHAGASVARSRLARTVQRPISAVAGRATRFAIQPLATRVAAPAASTPRWRRSTWDTHGRVVLDRHASTRARAASSVATDEAPAVGDPSAPASRETPETLLFIVEGMRCGGCSAAVSKVLNADPGVTRAAVNLVTATAALELAPGVDAFETVERAKAATEAKGFRMSLRPVGRAAEEAAIEANTRREEELERTQLDLYKALGLTGLCLVTHTTHHLHHFGLHEYAHGSLLTALGQPWVGGSIAALALLGPGRNIMKEGFKALANGAPNMNSLVGVGATAAFTLSVVAAFAPPTIGEYGVPVNNDFFEEPVLLLAFILLGRALESRARARAASDLRALSTLLPLDAKLVVADKTGENAEDDEDPMVTSCACYPAK